MIASIFEDVESTLKDLSAVDNEEKNEMEYVITQSKKNIMAWKGHLLRDINQDEAQLNLIRDLDWNSVLVVLDWAMKFLPRKYRESQSDWYGKRGISRHIAVAMTKQNDCLKSLTFVHVFQSCTQDSPAVLAIIDDVVNQLICDRPEIKKIFFRQDNAGCYHSAFNLLAMKQIATKYKVEIRVDFSDPQGGKGACDRKAATIKNKIKAYLNSGNDVETAKQMKIAIESRSGIQGVRVMLCDTPSVPKLEPLKWEGASFVNNISYCENGMKVWREYNIGQGKFIEWSEFNLPEAIDIPHINIDEGPTLPKATFTDVNARKMPAARSSHKQINLMTVPIQMLKKKRKRISCFRVQKTVALSRFNDFQTLRTILIAESISMHWNVKHFLIKQCYHTRRNLTKETYRLSARRRTTSVLALL